MLVKVGHCWSLLVNIGHCWSATCFSKGAQPRTGVDLQRRSNLSGRRWTSGGGQLLVVDQWSTPASSWLTLIIPATANTHPLCTALSPNHNFCNFWHFPSKQKMAEVCSAMCVLHFSVLHLLCFLSFFLHIYIPDFYRDFPRKGFGDSLPPSKIDKTHL